MIIVSALGDPTIVDSADIYRPPSIGNLEQPSYQDERGEIRRIVLAGAKVNVLHTRSGFLRSGDLHPNTQFDVLLSGEAELLTLENGEQITRKLIPNVFVAIRPYVPHLFRFTEDTVMLEWWDGPFECFYYRPFRAMIEQA
jgi:hypothetical protein